MLLISVNCLVLFYSFSEGFHFEEVTFSKDIDVHKNTNLFTIFFYSVKLTIMWIVGCFIRYVILFPLR